MIRHLFAISDATIVRFISCCSTILVFSSGLLAQINPPVATGDKPVELVAAMVPGGEPVSTIEIRIPDEQPGAVLEAYIRSKQELEKDLDGLRFFVQLRDSNNYPVGTVTVAQREAAAQTGGATIFAKGGQTAVQLRIADLNKFGKFSGPLTAHYGKHLVPIGAILVERIPLPKLAILGAPQEGALETKTDTAEFTQLFRLRSTSKTAANVRSIVVTPFLGPNSVRADVAVKIFDEANKLVAFPAQLSESQTLLLEMSGRFPQVGKHTSEIQIEHDGAPLWQQVHVHRERPAPSVEILGTETATGERDFGWRSPVTWRFHLHETLGKGLTLEPPTLIDLVREGAESKPQGQFVKVAFKVAGTEVGKELPLGAGENKPVVMEISGLSSAGKYTGRVQVGLRDGQSVSKAVALLVKDSVCVATACILLGVVVSYGIRLYLVQYQPQLMRLARAAELAEEIDRVAAEIPDLQAEEERVLLHLRSRYDAIQRHVSNKEIPQADAAITELDHKLSVFREWWNTRRRLAAVQPQSLVQDLLPRLETVLAYFFDSASDDELLKKQREELKKINDGIQKAVQDDLMRQAKELLTKAQHDYDKETADGQKRLDDKVIGPLRQAMTEFTASRFESGRKDLERASAQYAVYLAEELEFRLNAPQSPPGFEDRDAEWGELKSAVKQQIANLRVAVELSPATAIEHYRLAYAMYLRGLIDAGRGQIQKIKSEIDNTHQDPLQRKTLHDKAEDLLRELYASEKILEADNLEGASAAYDAVVKKIPQLANVGQPGARLAQAAAASAPVAATNNLRTATQILTRAIPLRLTTWRRSVRAIWWIQTIADTTITILVIMIAVLLGLKLLWADDPIWGGPQAYITAVLWGLGLHLVSGAAFGGVHGLIDQFAKTGGGR